MSEPNRITSNLSDEWPYSPNFQEFATFLGLPHSKDAKGVNWRHDKKTADKIEKIYAWGKLKSGSENVVDVMIAVKQLQRELGVSFRGKPLVDHLWGFTQLDTKTIKLVQQQQEIEKEKSLYHEPSEPSAKEQETGE